MQVKNNTEKSFVLLSLYLTGLARGLRVQDSPKLATKCVSWAAYNEVLTATPCTPKRFRVETIFNIN